MTEKLKKYETIGCCGIDCGLCPRFYTKGDSACPGCGGPNFKNKHPTCGVLSCCAIKNGFEVCSECKDYQCKRFESESAGYDSFVTHQKMFVNLEDIRNKGIEQFIENQKIRMNILNDLLANHDDGRAKSFFCIACTLLPIDKLREVHEFAQDRNNNTALKERCKLLRDFLTKIADSLSVDLKLKKKNKMIPKFPVIKTGRLLLRRFEENDLENVFKGLSDPDVIKYYGISFDSLEATKEQMDWFNGLEKSGTGIWWAVCSSDNKTFYGAGGLNNLSKEHKKAEIGFWLLPEFWGQRIMIEAMPFICDYGFNMLGLHRIEGYVESENTNCKKTMTKLDFQLEGTMSDCEIKNGKFISLHIYAKIND